jgi:hypothetical protein
VSENEPAAKKPRGADADFVSIDAFEETALRDFDTRDELDELIRGKEQRKRALMKKLVEQCTAKNCYADPDNRWSVLLPSGGMGPPLRFVADFYHNYLEPTDERLQSMAPTIAPEWDDLMRLPGVVAAEQLCARIRAQLRYSRPTARVLPCKSKKLQHEVPFCQDEALRRDIEVYDKLQNDVKAAKLQLKQLDTEPAWVACKKAAIDQMHAHGLRSMPYIEQDGDDAVEYQVVLEERSNKKLVSKKKLGEAIRELLLDKHATQSFDAFRLRLVETLQQSIEYSKTTNLKLVLHLPDETGETGYPGE